LSENPILQRDRLSHHCIYHKAHEISGLGGICSYRNARSLMERKIGPENIISRAIRTERRSQDGRLRYPAALRVRLYSRILQVARAVRPDLDVALCLEDRAVWEALGIEHAIGRCNCVL